MRSWDVAWVFGGSEGIGRAVAQTLASRGTRVALFSRRKELLDLVAAELSEAAGGEAVGYSADVEDPLAVAQACDLAAEEMGAPGLIVNCAGQARPGRFAELGIEDLRATLRRNLEGPWNVAQAALPHLEAQGGTIVQTSSLAGLVPIYGYSDYAAAKAGLIAMSEVLRQELAPRGIDVRVLCPPDVDTPGFAKENRTKPPETAAISATAKLMTPEAVAAELFAGLEGDRFLILPGASARWTVRGKRLFPGLVERFLRAAIRRASKA